MSAFNYAGPRHYPRSTSARTFPEAYYNEHHVVNDYPRIDPYSYPMGGPVSRLRNRAHEDQNEFQPEQGGARRRIAVACARCRKRKIRCTGDSGDGEACHNCKLAGVDISQCLFHRVGSDNVHKVMDNFNLVQGLANLASGHSLMPIYSASSNGPYHRNSLNGVYPPSDARFGHSQLDEKPAYDTNWSAPYGNDTSPIDDYSFEQSQLYLPTTAASSMSHPCGVSCRCTPQNVRSGQSTAGYYSDYGHAYVPNNLPYLEPDVTPLTATEPMSPLNMSSLQLTLPERPRQRQMQPTEVPLAPRRRLPAPTPRPGHGLHHALDQQQDQRLRLSQTIGTPSFGDTAVSYANTGPFTKSLLPWAAANENLVNAVNEAASESMPPPVTTSRASATTASNLSDSFSAVVLPNDTSASKRTPSQDLHFETFPLLDPSLTTEPTLPAYSNFRESRDPSASPTDTQLPRNNSSPSLYTYGIGSRRPSFLETRSSSTLTSGRQYAPLSQLNDLSSMEESRDLKKAPVLRASGSNINSAY